MLEGVIDGSTLSVLVLIMHDIQIKILQGKKLTSEEEKVLKLNLLGIEGERRDFRDEAHRDKLLAQWWKGARLLAKKFKDEAHGSQRP